MGHEHSSSGRRFRKSLVSNDPDRAFISADEKHSRVMHKLRSMSLDNTSQSSRAERLGECNTLGVFRAIVPLRYGVQLVLVDYEIDRDRAVC